MTRAILSAKATFTSICVPFLAAKCTMALVPMMKRCGSVRSAVFEVAPGLYFPPLQRRRRKPKQHSKIATSSECFSWRCRCCDGGRDHRPGARDARQAARQIFFFGTLSDIDVPELKPFVQQTQHIDQDAGDLARRFRVSGDSQLKLGKRAAHGVDDQRGRRRQDIAGSE
jgi:hypothetical protein